MTTTDPRRPTTTETERLDLPREQVTRTERVERVTTPAGVPAGQVNVSTGVSTGVNTGRTDPVWTVTRVVALFFTVLEVLLLVRFVLKFTAANPDQPLVRALYGVTEPLVRPFQGIFPTVADPVVVDLAALLAILFLFGVAALIVALVRAIEGRSA